MTLTISTALGIIKVIPRFKVSRRIRNKIEENLRMAVDDTRTVDQLLEKIKGKIPWADSPRGALVAYMTGQGLSQKRLSKITGIPQGHISQMVHGKRPIGPTIARKLGKALGVDYHWFL